MIQVTRLNGTKYWINPHQIETIECNPDVTLQMLSGKYYVIKETPEEILEAIVAYRRKIGDEMLKEALNRAIKDENYELASHLRDEIQRRKDKK